MQNKDLIIIALIVVIVYLIYQQNSQEFNQSPLIVESPLTQQLRAELNHYQKLYENRVKKDLGFEQENKENQTEKLMLENKATQTDPDPLITQHQEQLRKINLLFDEQAKDYQFIDFQGLYALLSQIAKRDKNRMPGGWPK